MIVGTDAFCSGDTILVVASGTQLGNIILIARQRLSPHPFAGRIMGDMAGTAGAGNTSAKSLYVLCGQLTNNSDGDSFPQAVPGQVAEKNR